MMNILFVYISFVVIHAHFSMETDLILTKEEKKVVNGLNELILHNFATDMPILLLFLENGSNENPVDHAFSRLPPIPDYHRFSTVFVATLNNETNWCLITRTFFPQRNYYLDNITVQLENIIYEVAEQYIIFLMPIVEMNIEETFINTVVYLIKQLLKEERLVGHPRFIFVINIPEHIQMTFFSFLRMYLAKILVILGYSKCLVIIPKWQSRNDQFSVHVVKILIEKDLTGICALQNLVTRQFLWLGLNETFSPINSFPELKTDSLKGCPMNLRYFKNYSSILSTSQKILEFETVIMEEACKFLQMHSTFTDAKPDIIYGGVILYNQAFQNFYSFPYLSTHLNWYVPCAKSVHRHGNIFKIFQWSLWLAMFVTLFVVSLVVYWIHKSRRQNYIKTYGSITYCLCNLWAVMVGLSMYQIPQESRMRTFLFLWMSYCLVMSTVFQALFTSFLIEPGFENQISKIHELSSSNLLKHTDQVKLTYWCNSFENEKKLCNETIVSLNGIHEYVQQLQLFNNLSVLASKLEIATITFNNMKHRFCEVEESVVPLYYSSLMRRDSVFTNPFNEVLLKMTEFGIIENLKNNYFKNLHTFKDTLYNNTENSEINSDYVVINLYHLQFTFCLLIFGHSFAIAVFLLEEVFYFGRHLRNVCNSFTK
ncbi:Ionotropic receptor 694 [Blattella germanica]|nr:Ionotropic receptor 694 [Blattella germanica]